MLEKDALDAGERTIDAPGQVIDPNDCVTMVTREVLPKPSPQPKRLERRIKTIDRIIHALKK